MTIQINRLLRWAPVLLFGVALAIFLILFLRFQRKPDIIGLDRLMAGSGERLEISGIHFGDGMDGSKLYIGANALTSTGIIEWQDDHILARVPRNDGAVLVKVKTRSGTSKGVVLGDSTRFPRVDYGPWLPGAPYIEYTEPSSGGPGSLVTIHGEGFGDRRGGGHLWLNHSDNSSLLGTEAPDLAHYVEADSIGLWTESMIQFWIPQGASSGNIYMLKGGQFSNPASVEITRDAGSFSFGNQKQWSLRQNVSIDRIGAFPGNSLYLHVPSPVTGAGQGKAVLLEPSLENGVTRLRLDGNLTVYRLDELEPGNQALITRQIVVETSATETEVNPGALKPYDSSHPELAAALEPDDWIRPDLVPRTAVREIGNLRDDWSKARALYNYVINLLVWSEDPPSREIPEYISTELADSEGYSFLFTSLARAAQIPARAVGGIIVLEDNTSRAWWWAEIWIEGVGWIPVDPALGDIADDIDLVGADTDSANYYFGGTEGRHIAFSRGILPSGALQPDPELRVPLERYTLQGAWEEVSGNLDSYASHWDVPGVTASY